MEPCVINRSDLLSLLDEKIKKSVPFTLMMIVVDVTYVKSSFLDEYIKLIAAKLALLGFDAVRCGVNELALIIPGFRCDLCANVFDEINRKSVTVRGEVFINVVSAGSVIFPVDALTGDDLIHAANTAVKVSNVNGSRIVVKYRDEYERKYMPGYSFAKIHEIISNCFAVYQPVIDWVSGRVYCYESLIRHEHVLTKDIIHACSYYNLWPELFVMMLKKVVNASCLIAEPISINIAPSQICHARDIFEQLRSLKSEGFDLSKLILEVTEGEPIDDNERVIFMQNLQLLGDMGVRVSVDDFGAEFSFFERLNSGRFHYVKIDRNCITNVHLLKEKQSLIKSIKLYCDELNIQIVAEGVELIDEAKFLASMGITLMQGFLFSKPIKADLLGHF